MKNYRYGKFHFKNYCFSWFAITILLLFSITSFFLELSFVFFLFPIVYAVIWLLVILAPHVEQFTIDNNNIIVTFLKKKQTLPIPSEGTLVVSYADICPPLSIHTAIGSKTHILKDEYAISILEKMPLDTVLEALHRNHIEKYTTSSIRNVFADCNYIYSFVCNQFLLDKLLENKNCLVIIPQSLLKMLSIDMSKVNVYIDKRG